MRTRNWKVGYAAFLSAFFIILVTTGNWKMPVLENMAFLSFSKAMASKTIAAPERQARISRYLELFQKANNISLENTETVKDSAMIRALFIAEYYRYQGDLEKAMVWYQSAIQSEPLPYWQSTLSNIPRDRLLTNGDLLVNDLSDLGRWSIVEGDTNVDDAVLESHQGIGLVSYPNSFDRRDHLAYILHTGYIPLDYHKLLSLRVKLAPGSYMTLATLVDGNRQRVLAYYRGTGKWETVRIPLEGEALQKMYFKFDEPGKPQAVETYSIWIDWIRVELE